VAGTFAISKIVSQISSISLTRIWIRFPDDIYHVDWKELAEVLNRPQFSQIREVTVEVDSRYVDNFEEWKEVISGQYHKLRFLFIPDA
jgi:hypothetical protein